MKNKKILICLLSLFALVLFWLVINPIWQETKGNISFASDLFFIGAIVILVALFLKAQWISLFTAGSYPLSFIIGILFQRDYEAPDGSTVNDMWAVWLWTFVGFILAGVLVECILLIFKRHKARKSAT